MPPGFASLPAKRARVRLVPMPIVTGNESSVRIASRRPCATSNASPSARVVPVSSAKKSSIDAISTTGVARIRIRANASRNRFAACESPRRKIACGHRRYASGSSIPGFTPYARAGYEQDITRLRSVGNPPITTALPASSGCTACSTEARKASTSTCRTRRVRGGSARSRLAAVTVRVVRGALVVEGPGVAMLGATGLCVEEPGVEEPRVEESRVDESRVDESRVEESRAEEVRAEEPRMSAPRVEGFRSELVPSSVDPPRVWVWRRSEEGSAFSAEDGIELLRWNVP